LGQWVLLKWYFFRGGYLRFQILDKYITFDMVNHNLKFFVIYRNMIINNNRIIENNMVNNNMIKILNINIITTNNMLVNNKYGRNIINQEIKC